MKTHKGKIYLQEQPETTVDELITALLPLLPSWVNYIQWEPSTRKLHFAQERNGAGKLQILDTFGLINEQLTEWEETKLYPIVRCKECSTETKEHTEVFEEPDGLRYRYVEGTKSGKHVVQTLDGEKTLLFPKLWEV